MFGENQMVHVNPVWYVILGIVTTVTAQIFLKIAGSHELFKLKWFLFIFFSLSSYGLSFLTYYMALTFFDISKISPIIMASCVTLIAVYGFLTGEPFNQMKLSGIALAIISIFLLSES